MAQPLLCQRSSPRREIVDITPKIEKTKEITHAHLAKCQRPYATRKLMSIKARSNIHMTSKDGKAARSRRYLTPAKASSITTMVSPVGLVLPVHFTAPDSPKVCATLWA